MLLINNEICFDPESRKLLSGDKSLQLTDNMSRCLLVLLLNRGNVVTKETLLKEVWQKNGVIVTETSIRQTLSQLRKAFTSIGLDEEIIFTLPRQGYKIDTLSEYPLTEAIIDSSESADVSEAIVGMIPLEVPAKKTTLPWRSTALILLLMSLLTAACMYGYVRYLFIYHMDYTVISENSTRNLLIANNMDKNKEQVAAAISQFDNYIKLGVITPPSEYSVYINKTLQNSNYSFFVCARQGKKINQCQSVLIYTRLVK